jgi:hypothetical protein
MFVAKKRDLELENDDFQVEKDPKVLKSFEKFKQVLKSKHEDEMKLFMDLAVKEFETFSDLLEEKLQKVFSETQSNSALINGSLLWIGWTVDHIRHSAKDSEKSAYLKFVIGLQYFDDSLNETPFTKMNDIFWISAFNRLYQYFISTLLDKNTLQDYYGLGLSSAKTDSSKRIVGIIMLQKQMRIILYNPFIFL